MTELKRTRNQVRALRRRRQLVRWSTAVAPLVTATLLILAAFWLVDYVFHLDAPQRVVMWGVCSLTIGWIYWRFAKPLLSQHESEVDVALLVEQQHQLDSDLVAAMQFDAAPAVTYGSPDLQTAVVQQAADLSRRINFFEGLSYDQFARRTAALMIVALLAAAACLTFPGHVRVFFDRLLLGAAHYPTQTVLEKMAVNGHMTLTRSTHRTQPEDCTSAQGQPVNLILQCGLPESPGAAASSMTGELRLVSTDGSRRTLPLTRLSADARAAQLDQVAERLQAALDDETIRVDGRWLNASAPTVQFDAPQAWPHLQNAGEDRAAVQQALDEIRRARDAWNDSPPALHLFQGRVDRLMDSVEYQVQIGDAWTDPARIEMIPMPVVTMDLHVIPPAYAAVEPSRQPAASRQVSVLEGSTVQISLGTANDKQLASASIRIAGKSTSSRWDFSPSDEEPGVWRLPAETPLHRVREELAFEVQVRDVDGLQPESPLRGFVRIRTDRPPAATMELVHRVVVPTATPIVGYRVSDDFGISQLLLHLSVQRTHNGSDAEDLGTETTSNSESTREIPLGADWLPVNQLPHRGQFPLDLATLELSKGDQVKLTLEAFDYRGNDAPKSTLSEAIVLDVSDEAGVLAAIAEADESSEERLSEVIKEQLGIGDTQ